MSRTIRIEPVGFAFGRQCHEVIEAILEELNLANRVGDIFVKIFSETRKLATVNLAEKDDFPPHVELAMTQACFQENPDWYHFSLDTMKQVLYHEMMHVADRLDPGFGVGLREMGNVRSNELWNIWIDGRLSRKGIAVDKGFREQQYLMLFGDSQEALKWFQWLWAKDDTLTFRELFLLSLELPWRDDEDIEA